MNVDGASSSKKSRVEEGTDEGAPSMPKHRVTSKGKDVPEPVDSFDALVDRYQLPSLLLQNLSQSGYRAPTGIQSHGIPIMLEVSGNRNLVRVVADLTRTQSRDLAAISPTGTGKTLSYLIPIMSSLGVPASSAQSSAARGVRAVVLAPTRELAHQIHNECLKLAQGRKWRIILFSKATASTLSSKDVRDKVGASTGFMPIHRRLLMIKRARHHH